MCFTPKIKRKFFDFYILWIKTNVAYTRLEMIARTKYCTTTTASNWFVTLYYKLLPAVRSSSKHGRWWSSLLLYSISMIKSVWVIHHQFPYVVTVLWQGSDCVVTVLSSTSGTSGRLQNCVFVPPLIPTGTMCYWVPSLCPSVTVQLPSRYLVAKELMGPTVVDIQYCLCAMQ